MVNPADRRCSPWGSRAGRGGVGCPLDGAELQGGRIEGPTVRGASVLLSDERDVPYVAQITDVTERSVGVDLHVEECLLGEQTLLLTGVRDGGGHFIPPNEFLQCAQCTLH